VRWALAVLFLSACQHRVVAYGQIDRDVVVDLVTDVARIRRLRPLRPVHVRLKRAKDLRESVGRDLADGVASGATARRARAWGKVGLVPWGFDLAQWERRTYSDDPAGYYTTAERRLYIVDRAAFRSDVGEIWGAIVGRDPVYGEALAHEIAHALVDQHHDLDRLLEGALTTDVALAHRALAEGDATRVGFEWSGGGSFAGHLDALAPRFEALADDDEPEWLRLRTALPYLAGGRLVERLHRAGGWRAVDAAYDAAPASTEQLLHPERYPSDPPTTVTLPPSPLGETSGRRLLDDTLGELGMRCVLGRHLPRGRADAAAAGWDGDAVGVWESGDAMLLVWKSVWDSESDAREWADAYAALVEASYLRRRAIPAPDRAHRWSTDEGLVGVERRGREVLVYEGVPRDRLGAFLLAVGWSGGRTAPAGAADGQGVANITWAPRPPAVARSGAPSPFRSAAVAGPE